LDVELRAERARREQKCVDAALIETDHLADHARAALWTPLSRHGADRQGLQLALHRHRVFWVNRL
jgi:hypothetical protein